MLMPCGLAENARTGQMSLPEPRWVNRAVIDAIHDDLLHTFGGAPGVRDEAALESALTRARNKLLYEGSLSLARLCACYGYGLSQNHPYTDGNKRCVFAAMAVFARFDGYAIKASEESVVMIMLALASGQATEDELVAWVEKHLVPYGR